MEYNTDGIQCPTRPAPRSSAAPSYRCCSCHTIQRNTIQMEYNVQLAQHHGVLQHLHIVAAPVIQYNGIQYRWNTMSNSPSTTEFCSIFISLLLLSYNTIQRNTIQMEYNVQIAQHHGVLQHLHSVAAPVIQYNTMEYNTDGIQCPTLPEPHDILQHLYIVAAPEIQKNTMEFNTLSKGVLQHLHIVAAPVIQYNGIQFNTMEFNTMSKTPRAQRSSAALSYCRCSCNTMQCNGTQYNAMEYNTMFSTPRAPRSSAALSYRQYSYHTIQCNGIQYKTMECNRMQCNGIQYNVKLPEPHGVLQHFHTVATPVI